MRPATTGCFLASSSASDSVTGSPLFSQPGLELLPFVSLYSLFSRWCQQPLLLKRLYLALIRALVKHSSPPFVLHCPRRGKMYYEHHFTQTSRTRRDSTIPDATDLFSAYHPESQKTDRKNTHFSPNCCFKSWLANDLLCHLESVATPLWASSYHLCNQWAGDGLQGSFYSNLL